MGGKRDWVAETGKREETERMRETVAEREEREETKRETERLRLKMRETVAD